jgi:peptidoglycan/xylan/chitin deacetylase (PgdA/CDA1 family)
MFFKAIIKKGLLLVGVLKYFNRKSKILYYHDIFIDKSYKSPDSNVLMGTSIKMFKRHLAVIKNEGYTLVPRITKKEGEVSIMFDDGFRGIWDNRHFFYERGICPTVFLAIDLIGKEGFLQPLEILDLQKHGFIFECHSWSHTNLAEKSDEGLTIELVESKGYLEKLLGKNVKELCLPIGFFSDNLIIKCFDVGYEIVYSSIPGNYFELIHGKMRARNLCQFASPFELKMILHGGNEIFKRWIERRHHLQNSE